MSDYSITSASNDPPRKNLARTIMVQGTSSHAGKSTVAAALCRILTRKGLRVAPFKAQNMSSISSYTSDGSEISSAQMLQAKAAKVEATAEMNPVLLKPLADQSSQVIILGKVHETQHVRKYYSNEMREKLWPIITQSLDSLRTQYDVVVIEGAGSPAEINLRERDLTNMRVARYAQSPVVLVGDIERGGVFASLFGTVKLLTAEERNLIKGFIINKFRGDISLIDPGPEMLKEKTGIPTLGVLPYFTSIRLPEEDSLGTSDTSPDGEFYYDHPNQHTEKSELDKLADIVEDNLDMEKLMAIITPPSHA